MLLSAFQSLIEIASQPELGPSGSDDGRGEREDDGDQGATVVLAELSTVAKTPLQTRCQDIVQTGRRPSRCHPCLHPIPLSWVDSHFRVVRVMSPAFHPQGAPNPVWAQVEAEAEVKSVVTTLVSF